MARGVGSHQMQQSLHAAEMNRTGDALYVPPAGGRLLYWGATVPTDADAGYAPGALFHHYDGSAGGVLYVNEGSVTSCDFNAVTTPSNIEAQVEVVLGSAFDTTFPVSGTAAGRGPSPLIWDTCPVLDYTLDPTDGCVYWNDFQQDCVLAANQAATALGNGVSAFTGATAGSTISQLATDPNGVVVVSGTTDDEDSALCCLGGVNTAGQFVLTSGKKSWFEARIQTGNITDAKYGFFCGFAEEGLLSEAAFFDNSEAIGDLDYLGFVRIAADGDKLDTIHRKSGGAAVTVKADAVTMAATTWKKIGFYCDGTTVTFYADGVALADTCLLATATVPTGEEMAFYLILHNAHGDDATVSLDWVRIAREF